HRLVEIVVQAVRQLHQVAVGVVNDPPFDIRHGASPAGFRCGDDIRARGRGNSGSLVYCARAASDSPSAWRRRRHCLFDTKNTKEAKRTKALTSSAMALGELRLLRVLGVTLMAP